MMPKLKSWLAVPVLLSVGLAHGCDSATPDAGSERGVCKADHVCDSGLVCLSNYCVRLKPSEAGPSGSPLVVSAASRKPRTTSWSVNYWQWLSSGNGTRGTESLVAALKPALLRIGGYNNDANVPEPFGDAELDAAVSYARAVGAEPILQVPLLADVSGQPASPESAAAMVTYANVTHDYAIKYFSIGNEPDLYAMQGSLVDSALPAIPGYTAADYCSAVTAYVAAMKAADPTIQIVGPDLSYKYIAGSGDNDWLTPILTVCGDQFDVITIHRYPFEAKQATLAAAHQDLTSFRSVMASVRGILQATGQASKPLGLTEMNVAYNASTCVLDASPGTLGAALWMADTLGTAIDLGLWTSAVWDIGDPDNWALGLLTPPPVVPRPPYYAYALFADHFGPTLLEVATTPSGVSAHASRNAADDATEVIAINWNPTATPTDFSVTGLPNAPPGASFALPATSITAVEIADSGAATAWTYSEAQRAASSGPELLAEGASAPPPSDAGSSAGGAGRIVGAGCGSAPACTKLAVPTAAITTAGTGTSTLEFGASSYHWQSYTYAGSGQSLPVATLTPDGTGISVAASFVPPVPQPWQGVGLFLSGSSCLDASSYTGLKFDFSGDLGGCTLALGANFSGDESVMDDSVRGSCAGSDSVCYPPMTTAVTMGTGDAGPSTVSAPFTAFHGGSPISALDPSTIITVQWQLNAPPGGAGCVANFSVSNLAFY